MKLVEIDTGRTMTLPDLHREWQEFKAEEPWNHADTFPTELHEILMATVNGRNDCDVVGLTPTELTHYILTLRNKIERSAF